MVKLCVKRYIVAKEIFLNITDFDSNLEETEWPQMLRE